MVKMKKLHPVSAPMGRNTRAATMSPCYWTCLELLSFTKLSLASKLFVKHVQLQQLSFKKIGEVSPSFTVLLSNKKMYFTN
jgi:hypothetical protein